MQDEVLAEEGMELLIEGDCIEEMTRFRPNSVDMVLCDLPYGVTQNKWDSVIPLDTLWEQYNRIVKPNGVVALTGQGAFTARLILSNAKYFKYKIVWHKSKATNFLSAKRQPLRKHEDICIFYRERPTYNPQLSSGEPYNKGMRSSTAIDSYGGFAPAVVKSDTGDRYPTDVVYFKTAESEPGGSYHATQKPVELGRYLIRTYTNPGDVVLDNAFGSGSFLVAAKLEGRQFIGIEKNEDIVRFKDTPVDMMEVARKRLAECAEVYK